MWTSEYRKLGTNDHSRRFSGPSYAADSSEAEHERNMVEVRWPPVKQMHVCMYVCTYVRMFIRIHVCMCVCTYVLQHRECKRTAPRRGWKTNSPKVKKISLIHFGCRNVSTCTESGAAHTSQSIQTALVQHTIAPTQSYREFTRSIDNKIVFENNTTRRSAFS